MPKMVIFWRVFQNPEVCGHTVLPDLSLLIGQKLVKDAKFKCDIFGGLRLRSKGFTRLVTLIEQKLVENAKCDILDDFQTLCLNWF